MKAPREALYSRPMRHGLSRLALAAVLLLAGCGYLDTSSNPLLGRWSVEAAGGGFALGTYEFTRSRMRGMGLEQAVDYSIAGDRVRVIPKTFGPTLEAHLLDKAVYEVGYELNYRPDWLSIPLEGLLQILRV